MTVVQPAHSGNKMPTNRFGLQLNIGHDLDGNVYDWLGAMIDGMVEMGYDPERFVDPPTSHDCWNDWGMDQTEFYKIHKRLITTGILVQDRLMEGELPFMMACSDRGHLNHVITSRIGGPLPKVAMADTYLWVHDHLGPAPIHSVIHSVDKTKFSTDILFDDHVDTIYQLLESDCLAPILVDRPWNRHATDLDNLRVYTTQDKLKVLLDVETTVAAALDLSPKLDQSEEDELREKAFWEERNRELAGEPDLPEHVKQDIMEDEISLRTRSLAERLRHG